MSVVTVCHNLVHSADKHCIDNLCAYKYGNFYGCGTACHIMVQYCPRYLRRIISFSALDMAQQKLY